MRPTLWLRAASILTLIHAILHTVGGVFGTPTPGAAETAFAAMKANTFPMMGFTRSYWDFYIGFGIAITVFFAIEAIIFWMLGNLVRDSRTDLRDLLVVFVIGYILLAANSLRFFFYGPVIFELLIAGCLVMAILSIQRQPDYPRRG